MTEEVQFELDSAQEAMQKSLERLDAPGGAAAGGSSGG